MIVGAFHADAVFSSMAREPPAAQCRVSVKGIIKAQTRRAQCLLERHRESLEQIVATLIERDRLSVEESLALVARGFRRDSSAGDEGWGEAG